MKYKVVGSILFICLLYSCNSDEKAIDKKFYTHEPQTWENYSSRIGMDATEIERSVFLFVQSSSCSPCLKELSWWDENIDDFNKVDVNLIVIEEFSSTFESFLRINDLNLSSYQDTTLFQLNYISIVMRKLFL